MNIKPVYKTGMELDPGRYRIEVSKDGYVTYDEWIVLQNSDLTVPVKLDKIVEYGQFAIHRY